MWSAIGSALDVLGWAYTLLILLGTELPTRWRPRFRAYAAGPGERRFAAAMLGWSATTVVLTALDGSWPLTVKNAVFTALWAIIWWRSGGGDTTRRLLRKLGERVAVTAAGLHVVPANA